MPSCFALLEKPSLTTLRQSRTAIRSHSVSLTRYLALHQTWTDLLVPCSAVTPFYTTYQIKGSSSNPAAFQQILTHNSDAAEAIRKTWKKGSTWCTIDVLAATATTGTTREVIVRQISQWE